MIGFGVGWSGLPMPRSIRSAPRARASALSSSSHAKTYVGRSVSLLDGTRRSRPVASAVAGAPRVWRVGRVLVIEEFAEFSDGKWCKSYPRGQISGPAQGRRLDGRGGNRRWLAPYN